MKGFKLFGFIVVSVFLFSGCNSREEKALETIRENLNKTLDDFSSYEPIETTIDSLKNDIYGDTLVVQWFHRMRLQDDLIKLFYKDYQEAKKIFDIWDDPRMYRYSNFAYNKRQKAYEDMRIAQIGGAVTEESRKTYLDTLLALTQNHTGKLYGWRVSHKFRCNNPEGNPSIRNHVYFMDKKCENIIFIFNMNSEEFSWKQYVNYVDQAYKEAKERKEK